MNVLTKVSNELSVKLITPVELDIVRFKDPGKSDCLYLALSIESTQKLSVVYVLVPSPKVKDAFSSSRINERYCPYIVLVYEFPGTIGLNHVLPLPKASA